MWIRASEEPGKACRFQRRVGTWGGVGAQYLAGNSRRGSWTGAPAHRLPSEGRRALLKAYNARARSGSAKYLVGCLAQPAA